MGKIKIINLQTDILINLVRSMMDSIPGVDNTQPIDITYCQEATPTLSIAYCPNDDVINVYDLSLKIQDLIYFKIYHDFDLQKLTVHVHAK